VLRRVVLLCLVACGAVACLVLVQISRAQVITPLHLNVNSLADTPDSNAGDGSCDSDVATAGEQCTLRAALQEANASAGADTITFDPALNLGTISLNTALPDIAGNVVITGPGANLLRIQRSIAGGTSNFRIFKVGASMTVTISGLTIANGNAAGATFDTNSGGGFLNRGTLTIDSCVVSGNQATFGGGISNLGTLTILRTTIANNTTTDSGAGLSNVGDDHASTVTIDSSTISDNTTATQGGGIFNQGTLFPAIILIQNSTISSNHAVQGAAVSNHGNLDLQSVTITANDASSNSGGIRSSGFVSFTNTILTGNTAPASPDGAGTGFTSLDYNLIGNPANMQISGRVSHNLVNVNPRLGPLAFNGGLTRTHELLDSSPAIDAGLSKVSTDQRGSPRAIDNPAVTNIADGDASDIGAYEAPAYEVNSTADTDDGACTLTGTGNDCTLREAITAANNAPGEHEITFKASLTASGSTTIVLSTGLPLLFSNMTITGPGANLLTIQRSTAPGAFQFRIFQVGVGRHVTISNLTIANGFAIGSHAGGGIWNKGNLILNNCNFYGNAAGPIPGFGNGGAIYNEGPSLVLNNCNIGGLGPGQANHAGVDGGGIFNVLGIVVMNGGSIVGNTGGGITAISGTTLNGVSITNNTHEIGAGVLVLGGGQVIENCLIANNVTTREGGAIFNQAGQLTVANTTISGNRSASNGGGLFVTSGQATLANVTITNNRSDSDGDGMGQSGGGISGDVLIKNSIVVGNSFGSDLNPTPNDVGPGVNSLSSFNLIGVCDQCGLVNGINNNQLGVNDAGLGPLANNGGPTLTRALLPESPALDAGGNLIIAAPVFPGPPFIDQRGFNRIADGPEVDVTDTVDIGAFEQQVPLSQLEDVVTNEDTELIAPFHVGDRSGITSITATSSNHTLVPSNANNLRVTDAGSTELIVISPARDQNGTTNITVTVNTTSGSSSRTFAVTVNPVNDAPSFDLSFVPASLEDAGPVTMSVTGNLSAGPPDEAAQTLSFQVISNSNPALFAVAPTIDSSGKLSYTAAPDASGIAVIKVVAKDNGGIANGGHDTSPPQTFTIIVDPVNDAPVNHLPQQQSVVENHVLTFSAANSNSITISDIDAGSAVIEVAIGVNNGVLTLSNTAGLTFLTGDGTADADMLFRGTIANINTALNGMTYTPNHGFIGPATLEIFTNDRGATGIGDFSDDNDSLNINVLDDGVSPVLLTEEGTQRGIALDSVVQTRDPFSLLNFFNFSNDHRRRVSLFVWRLGLLPTDTAASLTVTAEDDQGRVYPLTVEFVGMLNTPPDVAQINAVLPDSVAGAPRDLWLSVKLHGPASNKASIAIASP
jgi:CSLREA domain-containing protein